MITLKGNGAYYEGTSSDQKPTDVPVNTEFRELDTNCRYYYTGESWAEIPSSGGGGGGGSDNYNELSNKPSINSVTLSGDKSLDNLGIQPKITGDITISSDNVDDTGATNLFCTSEEKTAWSAKQDALTIDSSPTSESTNPVQSGGVYTALSGKQDTLAFNGTYNVSTNKAATESTVTTAIGNLDKSSVGLDNVTNNAQIKALSGSVTSGGVVTFGADGATVQDSGKTIETSLSDSNDKIPTSKAVRDNVAANATMASGYTADSAEASITSSTSINDAIEQLDYRTTTNKNNILLLEEMNGAKNYVPLDFVSTSANYTISYTNRKLIINGSNTSASSIYSTVYLPIGEYWLSGCPSNGSMETYVCELRDNSGTGLNITDSGSGVAFTITTAGYYRYNVRLGANYTASNLTISPMIITKAAKDAGFTDYQPYAMSNAELTAITPITKTVYATITTADTYQTISGLTCTCPAGKTIHITASGSWNNGYCKGIEIYIGDTLQNSRIIGKSETETGYLTLDAIGLYKNTSNADVSVNVAVKQSATGNNTYSVYATVI